MGPAVRVLVVWLALCGIAEAATVTHRGTSCSATDATSYVQNAVPAVNELLIVFVAASGAGSLNASVSDDRTGTYTAVITAHKSSVTDRSWVFVRNALTHLDLASTDVTASLDGTASGGCVSVFSVSGITRAGDDAIRQVEATSARAGGTTPGKTFTVAALTGNPTLGFVHNGSNPAGVTEPTGWTEGDDDGHNTPNDGVEVVFRDSGFTGTTITWGGTSATAYNVTIVEVDTSAVGAAGACTGSLLGVGCE